MLSKLLSYAIIPWNAADFHSKALMANYSHPEYFSPAKQAFFGAQPVSQPYPSLLTGSVLSLKM